MRIFNRLDDFVQEIDKMLVEIAKHCMLRMLIYVGNFTTINELF